MIFWFCGISFCKDTDEVSLTYLCTMIDMRKTLIKFIGIEDECKMYGVVSIEGSLSLKGTIVVESWKRIEESNASCSCF